VLRRGSDVGVKRLVKKKDTHGAGRRD
jgi:hypothetical protein